MEADSATALGATDDEGMHSDHEEAMKIFAEESFKRVKPTDAEGVVKNFASSSMMHKLKRVFDMFDIDGDGEITREELCTMIETLHIDMPKETVLNLMRSVDTDGNGTVDFEEFTDAMKEGKGAEFAELVTTASFPVEVCKILEEGNARFLSTFQDYVVEIVDDCRAEVLAAKVPLTSYGRVHTALGEVKRQLEGTAQELLATEFAHLRTGALESLNAQKESIEARNRAHIQSIVDPIRSEAEARIADADRRCAEAVAEKERLLTRFSEPDATMHRLQGEISSAMERVAELEAQLKTNEEDWRTAYPKALKVSSLAPPPLPPEAPYITWALEGRGTTLPRFIRKLDPGGTSRISKVDLRTEMVGLGATPEDSLLAPLDAMTAQVIDVGELNTMLLAWKGPTQQKSAKQPKAPKLKMGPSEGALERALDRDYAGDAHGSRLLFLIELYEKALKESEERHRDQLRDAEVKIEASGSSAAEAEAERTTAWEEERKAERLSHAEQVRAVTELLDAEKLAREADVLRIKETSDESKTEAVRIERGKANDLRTKLEASVAECAQLSEALKTTTAELQATKNEREEKTLLIHQTQQEKEADHDALEARLLELDSALMRAQAAQPAQGGYYFAAAPAAWPSRRTLSPLAGGMRSPQASTRSSSPMTSPSRSSGYGRRLSDPQTLFDKPHQRSQGIGASPPASLLGVAETLKHAPSSEDSRAEEPRAGRRIKSRSQTARATRKSK